MKQVLRLTFLLALLLIAGATVIQAQGPGQFSVECDDGSSFSNGVEFRIIQMRSGYEYTATAVGLNGFDPVMAILNEDGEGLCNDDDSGATRYAADLPTTGVVPASRLSSQINFTPHSDTGFQDISLVVGGYGDQAGEFVLILEGMAVSAADNAGDPLLVTLNQSMIDSGASLDVYMITRGQSNVDPLISMVDNDFNVLADDTGAPISCDDAGNASLCWTPGVDLSNSSVTINTGTLPGWQYDSYLSFDISGVTLSKDPDENWFQFLLSSYPGSVGDYLLVVHAGL
ncbi:MAG: hypothetical protein JNL34_13800 [Anaerolineae bacterium]|nr:hypothetical protein [Anaerolineae bacterium]